MWRVMSLVLMVLVLGGCGLFGGGAVYKIDLTKPDGTVLHAQAADYTSADSLVLRITHGADGQINGMSFQKIKAQPMSQVSGDVMQKLLGLVPAVTQ